MFSPTASLQLHCHPAPLPFRSIPAPHPISCSPAPLPSSPLPFSLAPLSSPPLQLQLTYPTAPPQAHLKMVYKHHNNTIRLTIQHKAALTTCVARLYIVLLDVLHCYDVCTPVSPPLPSSSPTLQLPSFSATSHSAYLPYSILSSPLFPFSSHPAPLPSCSLPVTISSSLYSTEPELWPFVSSCV